jgi:glycosyltransferase involved in cell wall biosynthesis
VLPLVRARSPSPVQLAVAGPHAAWAPEALGADVAIKGWVDDLCAEYRQADAVIAPIRAGGGTRIKALEAFAHRRPLVATPAAVEGIEVQSGEHYLAGDDAESFAAACLALIERPDDVHTMVERAYRLVSARYETVRVREAIRQLCVI